MSNHHRSDSRFDLSSISLIWMPGTLRSISYYELSGLNANAAPFYEPETFLGASLTDLLEDCWSSASNFLLELAAAPLLLSKEIYLILLTGSACFFSSTFESSSYADSCASSLPSWLLLLFASFSNSACLRFRISSLTIAAFNSRWSFNLCSIVYNLL